MGGGGKQHNMLRVRVSAAHMGGFWVQNSVNKGPFFARFSLNMGGFSSLLYEKFSNFPEIIKHW